MSQCNERSYDNCYEKITTVLEILSEKVVLEGRRIERWQRKKVVEEEVDRSRNFEMIWR